MGAQLPHLCKHDEGDAVCQGALVVPDVQEARVVVVVEEEAEHRDVGEGCALVLQVVVDGPRTLLLLEDL